MKRITVETPDDVYQMIGRRVLEAKGGGEGPDTIGGWAVAAFIEKLGVARGARKSVAAGKKGRKVDGGRDSAVAEAVVGSVSGEAVEFEEEVGPVAKLSSDELRAAMPGLVSGSLIGSPVLENRTEASSDDVPFGEEVEEESRIDWRKLAKDSEVEGSPEFMETIQAMGLMAGFKKQRTMEAKLRWLEREYPNRPGVKGGSR